MYQVVITGKHAFKDNKQKDLPKKLLLLDFIVKIVGEEILWDRPCLEPPLLFGLGQHMEGSLTHSEGLLFSLREVERFHLRAQVCLAVDL